MNLSLKEISRITQTELQGDENFVVTKICSLENVTAEGICYLAALDKITIPPGFQAGAIIVPLAAKDKELPYKGNLLFAQNPEWAFNLLLQHYDKQNQKHTDGIHPTAVISPKAKLGDHVSIGAYTVIEDDVTIGDNTVIFPQCYIGKKTQIGKDCYIYPQVVIREECILKDRVILQPGVRVGNDGFGFMLHEGRHQKVPQIGNVIIESDVEIQANSCVDRAKITSTVIGTNTKIDNLVQIAHNVQVGQSCIMCAQVGVAGTTKIGNGVVAAGQVGIVGHLNIGDGAIMTAQSGVIGDIPAGQVYFGTPARPRNDQLKSLAILNKLPEIYKDIRVLKKKAGM